MNSIMQKTEKQKGHMNFRSKSQFKRNLFKHVKHFICIFQDKPVSKPNNDENIQKKEKGLFYPSLLVLGHIIHVDTTYIYIQNYVWYSQKVGESLCSAYRKKSMLLNRNQVIRKSANTHFMNCLVILELKSVS